MRTDLFERQLHVLLLIMILNVISQVMHINKSQKSNRRILLPVCHVVTNKEWKFSQFSKYRIASQNDQD